MTIGGRVNKLLTMLFILVISGCKTTHNLPDSEVKTVGNTLNDISLTFSVAKVTEQDNSISIGKSEPRGEVVDLVGYTNGTLKLTVLRNREVESGSRVQTVTIDLGNEKRVSELHFLIKNSKTPLNITRHEGLDGASPVILYENDKILWPNKEHLISYYKKLINDLDYIHKKADSQVNRSISVAVMFSVGFGGLGYHNGGLKKGVISFVLTGLFMGGLTYINLEGGGWLAALRDNPQKIKKLEQKVDEISDEIAAIKDTGDPEAYIEAISLNKHEILKLYKQALEN